MLNYSASPAKSKSMDICPCCMSQLGRPNTQWLPNKLYWPNPSSDMSKNQDEMEVSYIKKMYPPICKNIQKLINRELKRYDHQLSPIYEMYPAEETINYIANCIYTEIKANTPNLLRQFQEDSIYTLIYALLLNELYRKRLQKRLYYK